MFLTNERWKFQKRTSKLTPETIAGILSRYLEVREALGCGDTITSKERSAIVKELEKTTGITGDAVRKILRRQAWTDVPLPPDWIPFV